MSKELVERVDKMCEAAAASSFDALERGLRSQIQSAIDVSGEGPLSREIKRDVVAAIGTYKDKIMEIFLEREKSKFLDRFSQLFDFMERNSQE